jgi:uroporphyrinogen decarboxylase
MNATAYANLMRYLGQERAEVEVHFRNLTAVPGEPLLRRFDIDTRPIDLAKPQTAPEDVIDDHTFRDEWGVVWTRPAHGHYIAREGPFQTKPYTLRDLDRYPWPAPDDPARFKGVRAKAQRLRQDTDFALVLNLGCNIVLQCQSLRGFGEWMEDLLVDPTLAEGLMEHVLHVSAGIASLALEEVGDLVDVVLIADDLGFQDRPYMRPELYRRKIKPYQRRLVETVKSKTDAKVLLHSDGAIFALIPDLIDIGVDAINPVQVSAAGMDSRHLKVEYGRDMAFWGAVDTHRVLPTGSPDDVRREVRRRIRDLAPGGGYVLTSVHNIQAEVPPENVVAMFDAALEHGRYPVPA